MDSKGASSSAAPPAQSEPESNPLGGTELRREDVCKLAYDESTKGLSVQDSALSSIRQSAAVMGTLAGVVATFLGKEVLTRFSNKPCPDQHCWIAVWTAIGALGVSLLLIVLILRPRSGWIFHSTPSSILDQFAKPGEVVPLDVTYDVLARFNEDNYNSNEQLLKHLFWMLYALMTSVIVQIVAWLIALV
ncbi:MAG TPA: hypothetical protein VFE97_27560 [Methylomirabilota bacterium]|nr:hypothetical protein [Methylomirabilota bacterium]